LLGVLAEWIVSERQALRVLGERRDDETRRDRRDRLIATVLYAAGLRVSELCGLKWRDLRERGEAGQVTVLGKGGRTRAVLLPAVVWAELIELRSDAGDEAPVFTSRKAAGHLTPFHVNRIVKAQAKRAGLRVVMSPHFLRHSHATHSMENGAPIHLVSATLGHASVATTGKYLHARPSESSSKVHREVGFEAPQRQVVVSGADVDGVDFATASRPRPPAGG